MLGPNGAGKSTLLGVLAGLLRPSEGHVRLGDADVTDVPPHRRGVGLLAQQALLFPHMTALANVAFGPRAHGVPRRAAEERARELLAAVDAAALEARRPAQMSGGQQQRVALARALAPDPDLLLLDEPLAALDVDAAPALRSLLRRIVRDRKQTALLVTHSALDALVLADRVVVLTEGRVVETGPARDVLARPRSAFTARIAGLDLVPGVVAGGGLRTADGTTVAGRLGRGERRRAGVAVFPPVRRRRVRASSRRAARATCSRCGWPRWSRWATSCGCGRSPDRAARCGWTGSPPTSPPRPWPSSWWSPAPTCGSW